MSSVRECCACFNWDSSADPAWRSEGQDGALSWYCPACWTKRHPDAPAAESGSEQALTGEDILERLKQRALPPAVDYIPVPKPPWWARLLFSHAYRSAIAFSFFFGAALWMGLANDRMGLGLLTGLVTGAYAVLFMYLGVYGLKAAAGNPSSSMAGWWLWVTSVVSWGVIGCASDLCYAILSRHTDESALEVFAGLLFLPPITAAVGGVFMLFMVFFGNLGRRQG